MHTHRVIFSLLLTGIVLSACAQPSATSTPSPTASKEAPTETTGIIPADPTPTFTATPVLEEARIAATPFEVQFQTRLESLPAGEYLVVNLPQKGDQHLISYSYVSLDGDKNGPLFTITTPGQAIDNYSYHLTANAPKIMFVHLSIDNRQSSLFIDWVNQKVMQFDSTGCLFGDVAAHSPVDPFQFAFQCARGQTWYIVSMEEQTVDKYLFQDLSNYTEFNWIAPDLAFIDPSPILSDPNSASRKAFCTLRPSLKEVNCFDSLQWRPFSSASPDGKSFVTMINENHQESAGILPLACLEHPDQKTCIMEKIPSPPNVEWANTTDVFWSPDGNRIVFINNPTMGNYGSTLWVYDLPQKKSMVLYVNYPPGDVGAAPGPWAADGEHFLVHNSGPDGDEIWLVSSITGKRTRVGEKLNGISTIIGLFQVP